MKRRPLRGWLFILATALLILAAVYVWKSMPDSTQSKILGVLPPIGAVITFLAALSEFTGWNLRDMWDRSSRQHSEYADFPFYVMRSSDDLLKRLFPEISQAAARDREIAYLPRGAETALDGLFLGSGRILIRGRSKTGKTREAAELLHRQWHRGLVVLLLKPYEQVRLPFRVPEQVELPHRNLVLLVDDIDHYCVQGGAISSVEAGESSQSLNFPERLDDVIQYFEERCGSPDEVRVLMTVRREDEFWSKLSYHPNRPPWRGMNLFDLPDVPVDSAQSFLQAVSHAEGLTIDDTAVQEIAARNDGTFLNLVLAIRDWKQQGLTEIGQQQAENFEGILARTWERRYERAVQTRPAARPIYGALDIMRHYRLTPRRNLVIQVAAVIDGPAAPGAADRLRLRARRTGAQLFWRLQRGTFLRQLSKVDWMYRLWKRLSRAKLGKAVDRWISTLTLYELPNAHRIAQVVEWLTRYEIPHQGEVLSPYDGQVDGRGTPWIKGERIASVLLPEGGISSQPEYLFKLLPVSEQLRSSGALEESLDLLERIIRTGLEHEEVYAARGDTYRQMGRYEQAIADYDRGLQLNSEPPYLYMGRAWCYYEAKRYAEAIADANKAAERWVRPASPLRCIARCHAASGNYPAAIEAIDQAIVNQPDAFLPWVDKARIMSDHGHFAEALLCIEQALHLRPELSWLQREKGVIQRTAKQYDAALESFAVALSIDPTNWVAYAQRGITLRVMRRYNQAIEALDWAVGQQPNVGWIHAQRGITLYEMGRYDYALESLDRAVTLQPEAGWIHASRGITLREMKCHNQALEALDRAVALEPEAGWIYAERGVTLRAMDRLDESLEALDRAVALQPEVGWIRAQRGATLRAMDRLDESLETLDRAVALQPEVGWIRAQRGVTLRAMDRLDESLEALDRAVALQPNDGRILAERGTILHKMGQHDEALEILNRAVTLEPEAGWIHMRRGTILRKMGRYDEALAASDRGLELAPKEGSGYDQRGITLQQMGRYMEALDAFERALKLTSDRRRPVVRYHRALTLLASGQTDQALAEYDAAVSGTSAPDDFQEAIDALEEQATRTPALGGLEEALAKLRARQVPLSQIEQS